MRRVLHAITTVGVRTTGVMVANFETKTKKQHASPSIYCEQDKQFLDDKEDGTEILTHNNGWQHGNVNNPRVQCQILQNFFDSITHVTCITNILLKQIYQQVRAEDLLASRELKNGIFINIMKEPPIIYPIAGVTHDTSGDTILHGKNDKSNLVPLKAEEKSLIRNVADTDLPTEVSAEESRSSLKMEQRKGMTPHIDDFGCPGLESDKVSTKPLKEGIWQPDVSVMPASSIPAGQNDLFKENSPLQEIDKETGVKEICFEMELEGHPLPEFINACNQVGKLAPIFDMILILDHGHGLCCFVNRKYFVSQNSYMYFQHVHGLVSFRTHTKWFKTLPIGSYLL